MLDTRKAGRKSAPGILTETHFPNTNQILEGTKYGTKENMMAEDTIGTNDVLIVETLLVIMYRHTKQIQCNIA